MIAGNHPTLAGVVLGLITPDARLTDAGAAARSRVASAQTVEK